MSVQLDQFGRKFPARAHGNLTPSVAADAVVFRKRQDGQYDVLLIIRGGNPYKDHYAFPGGFVDYNEDPLQGCLRELQEECGLIGKNPSLITVAGDPRRDPRGHVVSIVYRIDVDEDAVPIANDDAKHAQFYPLAEVLTWLDRLAFDHADILRQAIRSLENDARI
ncbi:unnamed protein product [Blepharisma stoltei]|uniref:Nudix hydrolase domain-containing protein n=1 Tax=Blepharisma stoltei TaxID=1481888 RepID=A0AAU9IBV8_9CILI|nr:unnamed protein product [Blepharisma stoltei]